MKKTKKKMGEVIETNKVLIDEYKGFKIYYDKEKERIVADKNKLDIHFEARTLWEIKGCIKELQTEELDKLAYIKSGYFDKTISKVHLLTINKTTNEYKYKILEDTSNSYDVGRTMTDHKIPKNYEINEYNTQIYNEVQKLQNEINNLEKKQQICVSRLK